MREMVDARVYIADNGFKPEYLHFLEEKMRASCPNSGFKAKPHIESCVKALKKDWTTIDDILTGVRHGCNGLDMSMELIRLSPPMIISSKQKSGAANVSTIMTIVVDLSDSESGEPNIVNVADSSGTRPARSEMPEASSKGQKGLSSDSLTTIGDYMLQAVEVIAVKIGKSTTEITKAILDDKGRRKAVVLALEEVRLTPHIAQDGRRGCSQRLCECEVVIFCSGNLGIDNPDALDTVKKMVVPQSKEQYLGHGTVLESGTSRGRSGIFGDFGVRFECRRCEEDDEARILSTHDVNKMKKFGSLARMM
ncbi:hypothetical protein Sjap_008468 [Stephania japonica]|uniref:Uncharacterized protein n=1 Tax=Stephania japonica TaxID=461633 RepID=A0AAP0PCD3_9MAGN